MLKPTASAIIQKGKMLFVVLFVLFVFVVTGCCPCNNDQEALSNMPQSPDMATEGELDYDIDVELAAKEGDPSALFQDYEDSFLSKLKWVARDGTIKNSANFQVNYKTVPDFKAVTVITERKKAFFDYLRPAIEYQNQLIKERRQILKGVELKLKHQLPLSAAQQRFMKTMRERYKVDEDLQAVEAIETLLRRVDTLPVSMVLSQAAMESAWGTSRFAKQANNLFGQWCFSKGCGLVPKRRNEGSFHEVRKFSSVDKAIGAYFLNINSFPTYKQVRDIRQTLRNNGQPLSGYALVAGLGRYSERGDAYIKELRSLIRFNQLEKAR